MRLGYGEDVFKGRKGNTTLSALLIEDGWYIIPPEVKDIRTRLRRTEYRGATISREQFLGVLANLTHIMLRAKFHTDQVEGRWVVQTLGNNPQPSRVVKPCFSTVVAFSRCQWNPFKTWQNDKCTRRRGVPAPCSTLDSHANPALSDTTNHSTLPLS